MEETYKILKGLSAEIVLPAHGEFLNEIKIKDNGKKLGIIYSSVNGNTLEMAKIVEKAAKDFGKDVIIAEAKSVTDDFFLECDSFAFGTPTVNHNAVADILSAICNINVVRNVGKAAFVFGSYGWSGEGVEIVSGLLKKLKIKVYKKVYKSIFSLSKTTEKELYDIALEFMGEIENA